MDVVKTFNQELSSLYEVKPPISKAKMTQITKSAIKGLKFYKHIVQSVEKFIQKCRPEYKVPGLYVVDSIVRQSRHQFGPDKDVFGPRFVKNISTTFQHLFRCSEEDRPKIIRVLNLWQKNNVFPIDVIQPLLDMGHPNTSNELDSTVDVAKESPVKTKEESRHKSSNYWKGWPQNTEESVQEKPYAEMSTKNLEKFNKVEMSNAIKEEEASRSSMFKNQAKVEKVPEETVKFNKKLLDFDYGDEDDEDVKNEDNHLSNQPNALALSISQNLLSNPELLRKINEMAASTAESMGFQSHQPKQEEEANYSQDMQSSPQLQLLPPMCPPVFQQAGMTAKPPLPDKDDRVLLGDPAMAPQDLDERSLASIIPPPDRAVLQNLPYPDPSSLLQFQFDKNGVPYQTQPSIPIMEPMSMDAAYPPIMPPDQHLMQNSHVDEDERVMYSMPGEPPLPPEDFDERQICLPDQDRNLKERSRSRSGSRTRGRNSRRRSRSRSPRRKRSRSRSHTRKNRSRSKEREKLREREREREKEKERKKKGIPPIKKGCVSVCSTTLWLGHVPKTCSEVDISSTFGEFGTILSIDMIPPRGCAYVVMDRRQDGHKSLQRLRNAKLQGSNIKMAWAPGKGVKGKEYKDYWEVDLGVSYIPYDKIKEDPQVLELLEEGGFIDEDSLPEHFKALRKRPEDEKHLYNASKTASEMLTSVTNVQTTPNLVPPPVIPSSVNLPLVLPHLMQPQFGLPLPGMLPHQAMMMQVPMGIPPPTPVLMVQQQSQGILSNQPMPVVGGVPQIVPRTIQSATSALQNIKSNVQAESVLSSIPPSAALGDATPTEEEGTNISSPNVQMSLTGSVSVHSIPTPSSQPVSTMAQFNPILGLNANRSMITVPPPVSTAGTPIPFPPPNLGFNFPPPGIRPPGQAHSLPPNPQFPWMQKQVGSPFTDADSSQPTASVRPVPPPQPGMPVHMFSNRPPFHESQASNLNSTPVKDSLKGRDNNNDQKPGETDGSINRNVSPSHHDKMVQEMAISTDDESSMDIEYSRNEMPPGPCFPGTPDFPRTPINMRMRGPPGPMPPVPRFRGMPMGSPFPMRMGGPRGMGTPGIHNRIDMEFSPHHGSRGPRMPMGSHGPRRNDMHASHDGRDWYPRDYEAPPFERERDRRFRDDWNRDSWDHDEGPRRNSRDQDESRRDDHRDSWNRERSENNKPLPKDSALSDKNESSIKPKDKPNKSKASKNLMDDLLKFRGMQRGAPLCINKPNRNEPLKDAPLCINKPNRNEPLKDKPIKKEVDHNNDTQKLESCVNQSIEDTEKGNEQNFSNKKEKDRESRKRSRWGRTLSEERELQQKRTEIELKFQSFEQSHVAQQPVQNTTDIPLQNSEETCNQEHVDDQVNLPESDTYNSIDSTVADTVQNESTMPLQTDSEMPVQNEQHLIQEECAGTVQNSTEPNELASCTDFSNTETINSNTKPDGDECEMSVTENKSESACVENAGDMDNIVANSNSNENFVAEDAITNNTSLVSAES